MNGWSLRLVTLLAIGLVAACTTPDPECTEDQVLEDGVCVDADTEEPPDTDIEGPEVDQFSTVTLSFTVDNLPSTNLIEMFCADRLVYSEDNFTARKTFTEVLQITPGDTCEVFISDPRGGLLVPGSLTVCTEVAATWEAQRGYEEKVAEVEVVPCIRGCTDEIAENYVPEANLDDGTCTYILGCTDENALNYDATATLDNGTCDFGGFGIVTATVFTDSNPIDTRARIVCGEDYAVSERNSFQPNTTVVLESLVDAGFTCQFIIEDALGDRGAGGAVSVCGQEIARIPFVSDPTPPEPPVVSYEPYEAVVAEFLVPVCSGCTNPDAPEFDPEALVDDGSCTVTDF